MQLIFHIPIFLMHAKLRSAPSGLGGAKAIVGEELAQGHYAWRLERLFGRKATNLPMSHYTPYTSVSLLYSVYAQAYFRDFLP